MEYQKRLRFIEYIKKNFTVQTGQTLAFHFNNLDDLNSIVAKKINNNKEKVAYVKYQKSMNQGLCFLCFSFDFGVYLDFLDNYLRYEEIVSENKCIHNSLIDQISTSDNIIRKEMAQLVELLSGKKLPDGKPNC